MVGIRPVTLLCTRSRLSVVSRLRMISAKPNMPIATTTKPMPSASSGMSNAMRDWPVSMSEPTVESSRPNRIMAIALRIEPLASTTAKTRPSTISEKYSAGPNFSASAVSGAPSAATSTVAKQPAMNEPMAAIASAGPARPCSAIWWPSSAVTTEDEFAWNVDQDRRGRAAILRAVVDAGEHDQRADRRQAEGDRQQHRDGGERPDAGQHADQRADHARRRSTGRCSSGTGW